ncbi:ATPase family AAA domain-containing protein 5b isoform X2 [Phyllopteryx taeniolatus]|uniref:ATPase family AAA domain-containing protein 5b isoform X2 n=1 Tax=Phyllopteryx taeniolatus TaxID=161469 RepID=UPI002AD3BA4A|nr:ATPase family AAA domain-containing protein 5b isoform X2 [Phyllopteryx taeniolatus]
MPKKLKRTKKSRHNVSCVNEEKPRAVEQGSSRRNKCGQTESPPQSDADLMGMGEKVPTPSSSLQPGRGHVPPPPTLHSILRDIQASNTAFPVQSVFGTLQRKARERLPDSGIKGEKHLDLKRKQESSEKGSKHLRSNIMTTETASSNLSTQFSVETRPRVSRLSRTRRLKQQVASESGEIRTDMEKTLKTIQEVSSCADVLWTDKYSPQCASELIGNNLQVSKLHRWLKMWKRRSDCAESKRMEQIKNEETSSRNISTQDSWDCGDFQGEAGSEDHGEPPPCNTMLITGPPGVGKTASVYACAQELGFQVFEVNSSSQRNGRQVLCQLREATQSHLVETAGKDPLRPAYFSNYGTRGCSPRSEHLAGTLPPAQKVSVSSKKQTFGRRRPTGKEKPAAVTLTNFFKMKAKAEHLCGLPPAKSPHDKLKKGPELQTAPQRKKGATSLILFEEVDVIFEDDVGFLAAIKTFMTTTKRPVVLTTNDPKFRERFSGSLEEVAFKKPSAANVCSYLQLLCLAQGVNMETDDVRSLFTLTGGDVRRCLLQLQLWVNSVQGTSVEAENTSLPQHSTGCTASMLGLHPVSQNHLLNLLKNPTWTEAGMNKLVESWRRDVSLLYSNMEMLTPIGSHQEMLLLRSKMKAADINPVRDGLGLSNMMVIGSSLTLKGQISPYCPKTRLHHRTEQSAANVDLTCLNALADFFDVMSYINATLATAEVFDPAARTRDFVWTGADIKDSVLDETSEEEGRSHSQERLLEIQAAVESLGCRSCWSRMSYVWTETQTCVPELGRTVSGSSNGIHFACQPPGDPIMCQRRYKMSQAVLSSQPFGLLGNRQAVCVDYMPALRSISRSMRQPNKEPDRCVHFLRSLHLGLSKSTLQLLAQDFSSNQSGSRNKTTS